MIESLRFLMADDDKDDSSLFESILHELAPGAVIHSVEDGRKAAEYLESCAEEYLPRVIILDYNMPVMSGPDVLSWLCSRPRYHGIDKFIWSTSSDPHYIDGCINKGAVEYFVKPASYEGTVAIVQKILDYANRLLVR
jgi:CheY-like chemotaxis protein